jgi:hypothetical protein
MLDQRKLIRDRGPVKQVGGQRGHRAFEESRHLRELVQEAGVGLIEQDVILSTAS